MLDIGDIVYLKSESKEMTIYGLYSSQNNGYIDIVSCVWLDKELHLCVASFHIKMLEKRTT